TCEEPGGTARHGQGAADAARRFSRRHQGARAVPRCSRLGVSHRPADHDRWGLGARHGRLKLVSGRTTLVDQAGCTRRNHGLQAAMHVELAEYLLAHIRGALTNGVTPAEICEVFLQVMIYAGVPAAVDSFRIANEAFAENKVSIT